MKTLRTLLGPTRTQSLTTMNSSAGLRNQTGQVINRLTATLQSVGSGLDQLVKLNVYVSSDSNVDAVVNLIVLDSGELAVHQLEAAVEAEVGRKDAEHLGVVLDEGIGGISRRPAEAH